MLMLVAGGLIIFGLSVYAGSLLMKLRRQNQLQKQAMDDAISARNDKIIESVNVIAFAAQQKQCDLAEAAIRLYMIMDHLQGERRIEFPQRYPALYELYDEVKDLDRGESRKTLPKKERMQQDLKRMKAEARLAEAIQVELGEILAFTGFRPEDAHILAS
ncbi:DUF2489 domain-containing protein [Parasalinivibrio latis]